MLMAGASLVLLILVMIILARQYQQCWQMHQQALLALVDMLSFFVLLYVYRPEVTVTSLHPSRLCRLAVFSIKPTLLSLQRTCIRPRRVTTLSQPSPLRITVRKPR